MAALQVTDLVARPLAVNPKLTTPELVKVIADNADSADSADSKADGRRHLMNPKKALAADPG
jgi:hypothetical protein